MSKNSISGEGIKGFRENEVNKEEKERKVEEEGREKMRSG
jgi:hypothetical protein